MLIFLVERWDEQTEHNFPYAHVQGTRGTKHITYGCYVREVKTSMESQDSVKQDSVIQK